MQRRHNARGVRPSYLPKLASRLSILCDIVGRELIVYDSFEGLPAPAAAENMKPAVKGSSKGSLETVQGNVRKYGVIDRCQFRKGWSGRTSLCRTISSSTSTFIFRAAHYSFP
ncbi:MAG TPA: TylF/MycF/NovP-related O-methyltransferase, partial [Acidimicrobiia bacterium]